MVIQEGARPAGRGAKTEGGEREEGKKRTGNGREMRAFEVASPRPKRRRLEDDIKTDVNHPGAS